LPLSGHVYTQYVWESAELSYIVAKHHDPSDSFWTSDSLGRGESSSYRLLCGSRLRQPHVWPDASTPCYAPYGEQSPPATSTQQSNKQLSCPLSSLTLANLKPSSLGKRIQRLEKKIKKGRGPKPHSRDDEVTSSSSSMNSSNNANNVGSDGVLITATSAPVSSRPSSGSPFVLNPMLAGPPPVLDPMFGPVQQERESILRAAFAVCTL
jgi:hypothetical protein